MKKENNLNVVEYLEKTLGNTDLRAEVIKSLTNEIGEENTLENWISFLENIENVGLESGIVKSMFYTDDVEKFVLENFNSIVDLINELNGVDIKIGYDFFQKLADFSYEYVCGEALEKLKEIENEPSEQERKCLA